MPFLVSYLRFLSLEDLDIWQISKHLVASEPSHCVRAWLGVFCWSVLISSSCWCYVDWQIQCPLTLSAVVLSFFVEHPTQCSFLRVSIQWLSSKTPEWCRKACRNHFLCVPFNFTSNVLFSFYHISVLCYLKIVCHSSRNLHLEHFQSVDLFIIARSNFNIHTNQLLINTFFYSHVQQQAQCHECQFFYSYFPSQCSKQWNYRPNDNSKKSLKAVEQAATGLLRDGRVHR